MVVNGIGKSGHLGQNIAATLANTGTPWCSSMRPRRDCQTPPG
jgi:hypothetical protein